MHGYVFSIEESCKYPFRFENGNITIYNRDAILVKNVEKYKIDLQSDLEYLIAEDIDTYRIKVFFVNNVPFTSDNWNWASYESKPVYYYLELKSLLHPISFNRIIFEFSELNFFYPVKNGFISGHNEGSIFTIEPIPYQQTKQGFSFNLHGKPIELEFGVSGAYRFNNSAPLSFSSQLSCSFRDTKSISEIIDIYHIIKQLFYFLCHRRSICFNDIKVKCIGEDGKYTVGQFHVLYDEKNQENESVIKETICIDYVKSHLNQLIQLVSDNQLYTENIPRDNESTHHITTASFILDAAAFEWSFKNLYREFVPSEFRIKVKQDILEAVERMIIKNKYNSKEKSEANLYSKIIKNTQRSFSERVLHALKDFDGVLSDFIKLLYKYNNLTYNKKSYYKIADELQSYRNAFAHGNIEKELKGEFILDTIILEWLNYCVVLKTAGFNGDEIFNILNMIFHRKFVDRKVEKDY